MQVQSMHFKTRSEQRLADARLQKNLKRLSEKFVSARADALLELDNFEAVRGAATACRDRTLEQLDVWLEIFEAEAQRRGGTVLWAETADEAARLVVEIARQHEVKTAVKTKSMVSEEIGLNRALEAAGVAVTETDLGEYILQINGNEPPSHIIAPVIHKDKEEIAMLFSRVHGKPRLTDIPQMAREARAELRPRFLQADMGITGANFLVAETGSAALVTNEGNEGMCTLLPRVHVVVAGIEKIVPTLEELATLMRLLPRSATGQSISNYFSLLTGVQPVNGPKHSEGGALPGNIPESDGGSEGKTDAQEHGARHMYYVLVDGGRTGLLGGEFQAMLRCIRCGACMNHCPVYQKIGGHSYGWVYPGPMGSVLTPNYVGLENALDLPQAATLCGQCEVVCPVRIPLPALMRKLREAQVWHGLRPWSERLALRAWAFAALRPPLYRSLTAVAAWLLHRLGRERGVIRGLPWTRGWFGSRDLPAPPGRTFHALYRSRSRSRERNARAHSPTSAGPR